MNLPRGFRRWAILALLWLVPGIISASQDVLLSSVKNFEITAAEVLISDILPWQIWSFLTMGIVWLWRHVPMRRRLWPLRLLAHLVACAAVAFIDAWVNIVLAAAVDIEPFTKLPVMTMLPPMMIKGAFLHIVLYWGVVAADVGLDVARRYREAAIKQAQLEARLVEAHLDALKMQLQPHFLFNTLNAISVLVRKHDHTGAVKMLNGLSDLLRRSLTSLRVEFGSVREELDFLRRYVDIETTRFSDRLRVAIDAEPAALDARIPNLILQPLVENAIKHGLGPRASGGSIEIRVRAVDGRLQVTVADDGVGLGRTAPRGSGAGLGLTHVRNRLAQLYPDRHRFSLAAGDASGAVATLEIPLEAATAEGGGRGSDPVLRPDAEAGEPPVQGAAR